MKRSKPDVTITNEGGGGFFVIVARSRRARLWLECNVPSQQDGTVYSDDRRCAWDIYQAMLADGLEVRA